MSPDNHISEIMGALNDIVEAMNVLVPHIKQESGDVMADAFMEMLRDLASTHPNMEVTLIDKNKGTTEVINGHGTAKSKGIDFNPFPDMKA